MLKDSSHSSLKTPDSVCLNRLSASQVPPPLLKMMQEQARWFHEYQTRSSVLVSLEQQSKLIKGV